MTRVALYARASTGKQEHSVPGQLNDLRADAVSHGRQIIEEVTDTNEKRHDAERPGLNRLRDLAESGAIDEVWAWAWDRYGMFPVPEVLAVELRDHGVELRSMDDNGGGEDGEDMQVIRSLFSRREQRDRVRKANRGRRQKSERGQLYGGFRARYGFRFVQGTNGAGRSVNVGYEPNPATVPNVVRIFEILAAGGSIHAVQREFEQGRIPNPSGKPEWSRTTIRNIVGDDSYRPHAVAELRELGISADVLDGLAPDGLYGVHWAGRKRSRFKGRGKKREVYEAPREEWIGVPISLDGSGLDRATVDRARDAIRENKSPSKVGDRTWELSGILKCAECGRNMIAYRRAKESGPNHYYYRCRPGSTVTPCPNRKSHPAERVESEVYDALRGLVDDQEMLAQKITESFAAKRRELSGPALAVAPLVEKLADLERRKEGYWTLAADGDMPKDIMRRKVAELDEQRVGLETALDDARHRDERLAALDRQEEHLLSIVSDGPDTYTLIAPTILTEERTVEIVNLHSALADSMWAPETRRELYLGLGLRVEIDEDGHIRIDGSLTTPPTNDRPGDGVANRTLSTTL